MKNIVIGTAGHIDHGKSALVLALTGTDPDRLEEEKRRGITIDLGFAHLDLGDGLRVAFVDVPGHERFVRNMLAGASGIDLVMLVVAADESIKPQTREHFEICKLLGIRHGLVVITKSDLVESDLAGLVRLEVQELVSGSFLENAPIVVVSARTGAGLDELKDELRRLSLAVSPRPADRPFRLPVDRAFVMKGFGTVVTGTLVAGKIEKETEVEIYPLGRCVRVRGVEVHNQAAGTAVAGQRTAVNLVGVEAQEIARGMVLAPPRLLQTTARLDAAISLLPAVRPLKSRARVHFHCGTAETTAEVVLIEGKELKPGARVYVQLRLADGGLFLPGDRFIIRQYSPVTTIGGGTVLDSQPDRHRVGDANVQAFLQVLENGNSESRLELLVKDRGEDPLAAVTARTGWSAEEVLRLAKQLGNRVKVLGDPPSLLAHRDYIAAIADATVGTLKNFHQTNPLIPGLPKEELRARVSEARLADYPARRRDANGAHSSPRPSETLFSALLKELSAQQRLELQGELVRLPGRSVQLSPEESAAKEQIGQAFEGAGLSVPNANEVLAGLRIDRARAEKILQILLKEKTLVRVTEGLVFHHSALANLRALLARRKTQTDRIDVTAFKDMTGLTRKYAIPLLEYLDRERVTRRQGEVRVIL